MTFDRSYAGILFRVFLLFALSFLLAYLLINTSWIFTPLVAAILLLAVVGELIYSLNRQQRELRNFLIAIKQGGYNAHFKEQGASEKVFKIFNEIIASFQELAIEKESEHQFLLLLTENMQAGLICYDENEQILLLNPTGKKLIGKPLLHKLDDLRKIQPELEQVIRQLPSGQSDVVKIAVDAVLQEIHVHKKKIQSGSSSKTLILLQNIQQQMDVHEFDSWQKLTKVMRHEIMNSLTPIVGLSEAIDKILRKKDSKSIDEETFEDMRESIGAIASRSKALVGFVEAYKNFSNTPELHKTDFDMNHLLSRVRQLVDDQLMDKHVTLHTPAASFQVLADESLLEGVILNLVKNALEASSENGNIYVHTMKNTEEEVTISVADDGTGVSQAQLDKIFIPFFTTKETGSGIGLSLARKIVQLHNGKIYGFANPSGGLTITLHI